jgi:hypothetical protein
VKLFYARDFRALMLKFGRLALVEELSGASGHLSPDRGPEAGDALSSFTAASADPAGDEPPGDIA